MLLDEICVHETLRERTRVRQKRVFDDFSASVYLSDKVQLFFVCEKVV